MSFSGEKFVVLGGLYCLGFALFHLMFWKVFGWKRDLASLTFVNRAVMQVLNLSLTVAFVVFAVPSLLYPAEMLNSEHGRWILGLVALFWFLRAAQQVVFFGLRRLASLMFFLVFILGGLLYAFPLLLEK